MTEIQKTKKFKLLKEYFEKEPSVILAFLFGSFAKGFEMKESDFDVAVYLKEEDKEDRSRALPWGTRKIERAQDKIWSEISHIVKDKEVDLVCLNEAPASLISSILKTGIPLVIKDKKLYWELYLQKSTEAEDFFQFLKDFWRIKKKAKSLDRETRSKLMVRIDYLRTELQELDRFKNLSWEEYSKDRDKRKLIEKWVENILNATIDIAKIILASEKKEMPKSYEDALFGFAHLVGFDVKESERFAKFANLRNILAHEYLDILYGRIQNFIQESPKFYKRISQFLEEYTR